MKTLSTKSVRFVFNHKLISCGKQDKFSCTLSRVEHYVFIKTHEFSFNIAEEKKSGLFCIPVDNSIRLS